MTSDLTPWTPQEGIVVPSSANTPEAIAGYAKQLTRREKSQLVSAFSSGNYEMGSQFLWSRSMAALKKRLSSLGTDFIGEMLDRPEIGGGASLAKVVTDFEAVTLAEELGMFSRTQAMRLRHAMELVGHFAEPPDDVADDAEREMMPEDGMTVLRACVQSVLGAEQLDVAMEFAQFRQELEERTFRLEDAEIAVLASSPKFFQSTTLRVLMALAKTTHSAQLEHVLANVNVIVPALWKGLYQPDRWLVGRTYAELHAEGQRTAASGVRKALLKVRGFDFVPEDLRSRTFIQSAKKVLEAHNGVNNFYHEAAPMNALASLGTVVPMPAFPQCMTAALSVRLGNYYGDAWSAQAGAMSLLDGVTPDRWTYYLDQCLPSDLAIISKLSQQGPCDRWLERVVAKYSFADLELTHPLSSRLVENSVKGQAGRVRALADQMYAQAEA